MDVDKKVSDSGKQGHTTVQAARLVEMQGLMDMDVMEEWTLEAVKEKNWKVISCKFVTTERDHIGSGIYTARYVARGFEEKVDDTGRKNYAATAGMHSCKILLARAMASQLGTGHEKWAVKIADVSQAFLYADVAEGMNTFVEAPDEYYQLRNLNKEKGTKVRRLKKAWYGLRSSPMLWQCQLQRALEKLGFQPDLQDPVVYLHENGMMLVNTCR